MLKQFILGTSAQQYIREELSYGMTLANYLLNRDLTRGRISTYLPESIRLEEVDSFRGIVPVPLGETKQILIEMVTAHVTQEDRSVALFENQLARPYEGGYLNDPAYTFVALGPEVYHFIGRDHVQANSVAENVLAGKGYPFIGVLTRLPPDVTLEKRQEITQDLLQAMASNTQILIVGAYDGCGTLYWTPQNSDL